MGAFFRVTLPLAIPGIAATALYVFLDGWNQYLLAYILTSSSQKWVISLGLFSFVGEYFVEIEQMMAASVVASLPALLVFAMLQRYMRGGLALGGMKG
jgi:ABC-type glycerol-3-phosphate transport system permease component